jgi:hypothetical protein
MTRQAEDNICIAKEYLGVKLLAIAVLEALALSTGGDVPLAMFVGDVRSAHENTQRAEDYLPAPDVASDVPHNDVLLSLLGYGRSREISFDMRASPLSYHIYATLGAERGQQLLACAKAMFAGDMTPQDFLDHLGKPLIAEIAQACASLAHTRRTALLALGSAVGGSHDV